MSVDNAPVWLLLLQSGHNLRHPSVSVGLPLVAEAQSADRNVGNPQIPDTAPTRAPRARVPKSLALGQMASKPVAITRSYFGGNRGPKKERLCTGVERMGIPEVSESIAQPGPLRPKKWGAPDSRVAVVWSCFPSSARRSGAQPQAPRRRSLRLGGARSVRGRDVTHLGWEVPAQASVSCI